jgi:PAS domain S-box-containing protein
MNLKTKIVLGYLLILLIAAFCSVVAIKKYTEVMSLYEEINSKYYQTVKIAQELTYRIMERQASIRGFLLTGKTRYLIPYDENILPIKSLLRKAREVQQADTTYLDIIRQYEDLIKKWQDVIAEAEKELRQELDYGIIDFHTYITSISDIDKKGRPILRALPGVENQLIQKAEQDMSHKSSMALRVGHTARTLLIAIAAGSLILGALFGILLSNHITTPLKDVVRGASSISRGEFSQRIKVDRRDELGILASSFNQMAERLEKNIENLKESEEKYATLVEKANDGIVIIQDMKFLFVNRKFCEITGYSKDELIGSDFFLVVSSDTLEIVKKMHRERMEGKEVPSIYETKLMTKKDGTKDVEVNAGLIEYKDKKADLVVFRDLTDRKMYQRDLRNFSEKLIVTLEEERKRISRELHDEIGQALSAININVEIMEKNQVIRRDGKRKLTEIKKLIEKTIDDIHRISYDLRPYMLDEFGLISALRWFADTYQERTSIEVSVLIEGGERNLPQSIDTLIYRVAQEGLTNVSKHANAGKAEIILEYHEDSVELFLRDDGQGFDQKETMQSAFHELRGLGLFGIRERLALFGGALSIESEQGKGTTLCARIPLKGNELEGVI